MAAEENMRATKLCTIEATVPTGFEEVAREEAVEKFGTECRTTRGKIVFQTSLDSAKNVLQLGGIDNCRVQMYHTFNFGFSGDAHDCLSRLQLLVKNVNWAEGLAVWKDFYTFHLPVQSCPEKVPTDEELIDVCIMTRKPEPKKKQKWGQGKERSKGGKGQGFGKKRGKQKCTLTPQEQAQAQEPPGNVEELEATSHKACIDASLNSSSAGKEGSENGKDSSETRESSAWFGLKKNQKDCIMIVSPEDQKLPANTVIIEDLPQKSKPISAGGNLLQEQDKQQTSSTQSEVRYHIAAVKNETSGVNVCPGVNLSIMKEIKGDQAVVDSVGETATLGTYCDKMPEKLRNSDNTQQNDSSGESTPQLETKKSKHDATKPTFRVTCNRAGENHSFDSMSAAASFGSAVQTYFGWNVDMKNFDIEVILNIDYEEVSVGIGLTRESLHYRNLVAFGPTTLRPTICHNMLRMCRIRDGHIVCDPMCGTGSISIQGSLAWPKTFQLCGENHPKALERVILNTQALNQKRTSRNQGTLKTDALRWDACHLPVRDSMVDIFVTDLPFGNRVGSRVDNRKLYPKILDEMARVGRAGARACLLTEDKTNIIKAIQQTSRYWQRRRILSVNIGGLAAGVFLLLRTTAPYTKQQRIPNISCQAAETNPLASLSSSCGDTADINRAADCIADGQPSLSPVLQTSFMNGVPDAGNCQDFGDAVGSAMVPTISDDTSG